MTSLRKRQANRANAQRSTGPRTAAGRAMAAQNARHHGLSVALPAEIMATLVTQLAAILAEEGLGAPSARELAMRIIDYERNVAHEREVFAAQYLGHKQRRARLSSGEPAPDYDAALQQLQNARIAPGSRLGKAIRQELASRTAQYTFIIRTRQRYDDWVDTSFLRYHRRATNQLLKAFKALG
jgi:hypothetical protein